MTKTSKSKTDVAVIDNVEHTDAGAGAGADADTGTESTKVIVRHPEFAKYMSPNVVLITVGYRTRARSGSREVATLTKTYTQQADLTRDWLQAIANIPSKDYVIGAGEGGIFTETLAVHSEQVCPLEQAWAISFGCGPVNLAGEYPQYDLGDYDANMQNIVPFFDPHVWWHTVSKSVADITLQAIVAQAIADSKRVVFAMGGPNYFEIRADLENILKDADPEYTQAVYSHVRFIGADLNKTLPPKLLPCAMPYDSEAIDRIIPGSRATLAKRGAILLEYVSPAKEGGSKPLKDADLLKKLYAETVPDEILYFDSATLTRAGGGNKLSKVDDADAESLIRGLLKLVPPDEITISRMLRSDGYSVTAERAKALITKVEQDDAAKTEAKLAAKAAKKK